MAVAFANFTGVLTDQISATHYLIEPVVVIRTYVVGPFSMGGFVFGPFSLGSYAIGLSTQQIVAILMILLLTAINTRGLKTGKLIQNTFTFTKTAALMGLIIIGVLFGWNHHSAAFTSSWWHPAANGWTAENVQPGLAGAGALVLVMLLGRAMTGPLFAQSAWNNVTFTAGEVQNPGRNLPRALLIGCGTVVTLYLLANLAYVVTLPLAGIQGAPQGRVATATMQAILGSRGTLLMAVAIMVSTFGCNNGLILAGARVYYAMARDGLFFSRVGLLNARHVPSVALITQGIWAALLTLPRTVTNDPRTGAPVYGNVYTQLLEYIISADLIFYTLMVGAVVLLRRQAPDLPRPYRTFAYPLAPVVYIVLAIMVVLDLAYLAPRTSGVGYLLVLTGIPAYLIWRRSPVLNPQPPATLTQPEN